MNAPTSPFPLVHWIVNISSDRYLPRRRVPAYGQTNDVSTYSVRLEPRWRTWRIALFRVASLESRVSNKYYVYLFIYLIIIFIQNYQFRHENFESNFYILNFEVEDHTLASYTLFRTQIEVLIAFIVNQQSFVICFNVIN